MTEVEQQIAYLKDYISPNRYERIVEVSEHRTNYLTVVVENLYQSHNMSAVLRTAECLGIQNVHIIENKFKYQLSKEVSMGADKWLDLHRYNAKEDNTEDCINKVKSLGYKVVATMPAEKDSMLNEVDISTPTAFLFGTELLGLSPKAIALADEFVKIPMYGFTESYNISVSMALTMMNVTERMRHSDINWRLPKDELSALQLEWIKKSLKVPEGILSRYESEKR